MSLQVYSLTSPAFRPVEIRHEQGIESVTEGTLHYWASRLVTCWHREMSRPFTRGDHTYRTCARCGMKRDFDLQTWRMKGRYYRDYVGKAKFTLVKVGECRNES